MLESVCDPSRASALSDGEISPNQAMAMIQTLIHSASGMTHSLAIGMYLTNETFLYRVVGLRTNADPEVVELEDCFLLDIVHVPKSQVTQRRLRLVAPDLGEEMLSGGRSSRSETAPVGSV